MLTYTTFLAALRQLFPDAAADSFLLAVSGGADSMVLLHLFQQAGLRFEVAHVNYKLRGEESDADQKTVEEFCHRHAISLHVYEVTAEDQKPENSVQLWARDLRYGYFRKIQKESNLQYLVTAHHLNDQLETFLINLSKAAGLNGLSGIPANDNGIIRPLLNFSKEDIYAYADRHEVPYREDVSNQKSDYLRNFIRHEVAPKLFKTNTHFLENFGKSLSYLNQARDFINGQIQDVAMRMTSTQAHKTLIQKNLLLKETPFVQFGILRKYGFESATEISKIVEAGHGKTFHSSKFTLTVDRHHYIIQQKNALPESPEVILQADPTAPISLEGYVAAEFKTSQTWAVDARKVRLPLRLCRIAPEVYFYPSGMVGRKKISKFFKDEKMPILAQQKIWFLCDADNRVLGIIPKRQDRRFMAAEDAEAAQILIKF